MAEKTILAQRIKIALEKSNLKNQAELAAATGLSPQRISQIINAEGEKGSGTNPTIGDVKNIAEKLGVSIDWLCGNDNRQTEDKKLTLYDAAIVIMQMIGEYNYISDISVHYETATVSHPCLVFDGGWLEDYLIDFKKIEKLHKEYVINDKMFDEWTKLRLESLKKIQIKDENTLPF